MVGYGATLLPCQLLLARWTMQTCITGHRAGPDESQARAENDFWSRRRSRSASLCCPAPQCLGCNTVLSNSLGDR